MSNLPDTNTWLAPLARPRWQPNDRPQHHDTPKTHDPQPRKPGKSHPIPSHPSIALIPNQKMRPHSGTPQPSLAWRNCATAAKRGDVTDTVKIHVNAALGRPPRCNHQVCPRISISEHVAIVYITPLAIISKYHRSLENTEYTVNMDKLKDKLHIGTSKSKKEEAAAMGRSSGDDDGMDAPVFSLSPT